MDVTVVTVYWDFLHTNEQQRGERSVIDISKVMLPFSMVLAVLNI